MNAVRVCDEGGGDNKLRIFHSSVTQALYTIRARFVDVGCGWVRLSEGMMLF